MAFTRLWGVRGTESLQGKGLPPQFYGITGPAENPNPDATPETTNSWSLVHLCRPSTSPTRGPPFPGGQGERQDLIYSLLIL